jgi:hypothetical protein
MGTRAEINDVLPVLTAVLVVQEVSEFYLNRGASQLGRVYLEVAGPLNTSVRATAVRTDRPVIDPTPKRGEIQ